MFVFSWCLISYWIDPNGRHRRIPLDAVVCRFYGRGRALRPRVCVIVREAGGTQAPSKVLRSACSYLLKCAQFQPVYSQACLFAASGREDFPLYDCMVVIVWGPLKPGCGRTESVPVSSQSAWASIDPCSDRESKRVVDHPVIQGSRYDDCQCSCLVFATDPDRFTRATVM
jgi:hypothetical protein